MGPTSIKQKRPYSASSYPLINYFIQMIDTPILNTKSTNLSRLVPLNSLFPLRISSEMNMLFQALLTQNFPGWIKVCYFYFCNFQGKYHVRFTFRFLLEDGEIFILIYVNRKI